MAEMTLEGVDARPEDSAFALGRVHSIETMGTVDGPGIRFVVFVQGCPMRCAYCHNPDTWSVNGGTMVTVEHLMDEFQSNHEFYRSGGITVSGGEPLLQPEFLADLFRAMHNNPDGRVHTCLDSCGYAFDPQHPEKFDAVLNETDMVLLDIKHADPVEHKKLTGCDPARILAFGDELARRNIKVVIRHVVVPGITTRWRSARSSVASSLHGTTWWAWKCCRITRWVSSSTSNWAFPISSRACPRWIPRACPSCAMPS